jgi:ADP-ribosylglycohydrolase
MIGAIIGDIVGSRFEFHNTDNRDFELFTRENNFTDDTICTIAIADAINTGASYKDKLVEWCRRYPNPMGAYGGSFARWITSENHEPYNSYGNGSAMRVAPVAWAFEHREEVLLEAAMTAEVSHNHPEGIKGAQAVAHAIFSQRKRKGFDPGVLEIVGNTYYPGFLRHTYTPGVFDETCQGTVPICLKIVRYSSSFEDAIRKAITWGGDSDTIGAIVGSIAEAAFGIPKEISHQAFEYLPEDMLNVIGDYYHKLNTERYERFRNIIV